MGRHLWRRGDWLLSTYAARPAASIVAATVVMGIAICGSACAVARFQKRNAGPRHGHTRAHGVATGN